MIHPIPSGTLDVLPDELRELRAITDAMREVFAARGYGEVATPALEYEEHHEDYLVEFRSVYPGAATGRGASATRPATTSRRRSRRRLASSRRSWLTTTSVPS